MLQRLRLLDAVVGLLEIGYSDLFLVRGVGQLVGLLEPFSGGISGIGTTCELLFRELIGKVVGPCTSLLIQRVPKKALEGHDIDEYR